MPCKQNMAALMFIPLVTTPPPLAKKKKKEKRKKNPGFGFFVKCQNSLTRELKIKFVRLVL